MRFLGLPWDSQLVLIVLPLAVVSYQYYICWQIETGGRA